MIIEKCFLEDLDRIMELDQNIECAWTKENFLSAFGNGITHFLKAVEGDFIFGYVSFDIILDEICINNIAVDVAFRRRGVGSLLMEYVIQLAEELKKQKIFLEVNEHNLSAIALYKKLGFEFVSLRRNYYGKNKNAAVYIKNCNGTKY